jgi:hypothetical protein
MRRILGWKIIDWNAVGWLIRAVSQIPQRSRWTRSLMLALMAGIFIFIGRANAATTVLLQNRDVKLNVPMTELQIFAATGQLSDSLQTFFKQTQQDPTIVRDYLTSQIRLTRTALVPREFGLIQVNKVIGNPVGREDQLDLLDRALQTATRKDTDFSVMELLENYPAPSVRLSTNRLETVYEDVSLLFNRLAPILYRVDQLLPELVCNAQGLPVFDEAISRSLSVSDKIDRQTAIVPAQTKSSQSRSPEIAALPDKNLIVTVGPFRPSISLQELAQFVETGELSAGWRFYLRVAKIDREAFRATLTRDLKVSAPFLDQNLNHLFGEYLLYQAGQVVHSSSKVANIQSLRSALVLAAQNDGRVDFLEILTQYPHPQMYIDALKLVKFGSKIMKVTGGGSIEGTALSVSQFLVDLQRPIATEECVGNPVPPAEQPQVKPLQLSAEQRAQYLPANWQPIAPHKEEVGNIKVVWLQGSPYDMGFQHGQLLKDEIATLGKPALQLLDLVGHGMGLARLAEKRSFPYATAECRGMAESAKEVGMTYDACLVLAYGDVYQYVFGNALPEELMWEGCSQFVAAGAATVDGNLYHGSTVDDHKPVNYMINNPIVFVRQPDEGLPHVFVTYPGVVWPNSGLNVASMTLGLDTAVTHVDGLSLYGGSNVQFMSQILQSATTFEEAVAFMESQPRVRPNIIMVADGKSQKAGVFEFSGQDFAVRAMDSKNVLYATNHFESPAVFDKQADPQPSTLLRFKRYQQLLEPNGRDTVYGQIDPVIMTQVLRDRTHPETLEASPLTVFDDDASIGGNGSQRQAIYESKHLLFWVAAGPPPVPENPFMCFSLGQLLEFPNAVPCPAAAIP